MLAKRLIPCLDVKDGQVVKGVQFKNHAMLGDVLSFAQYYRDQGADELVFYDITASAEGRSVSKDWVYQTAKKLDIPFCVAGGIRSVSDAAQILKQGADKISINSPALENPDLINELANEFGSQCVVVGVDSMMSDSGPVIYQYTGAEKTIQSAQRSTLQWLQEIQERGAGEVVLNCMNQDGMGQGYDHHHLKEAREILQIPLVASGGAGQMDHFREVFEKAQVDAALAAGVFHRGEVTIPELKAYLQNKGIRMRL